MSTATPAKAKEIPAQADVRTRGSVTTVKLTAAGNTTAARVDALLDELVSNSAVPENMRQHARAAKAALDLLARSLTF